MYILIFTKKNYLFIINCVCFRAKRLLLNLSCGPVGQLHAPDHVTVTVTAIG